MMNVLFVCTANEHRSRTAETIFKNEEDVSVKSAGTDENSVVPLTKALVEWADFIFVMEQRHYDSIYERFPNEARKAKMRVLGIPDVYNYMDRELVRVLKEKTRQFFS